MKYCGDNQHERFLMYWVGNYILEIQGFILSSSAVKLSSATLGAFQ